MSTLPGVSVEMSSRQSASPTSLKLANMDTNPLSEEEETLKSGNNNEETLAGYDSDDEDSINYVQFAAARCCLPGLTLGSVTHQRTIPRRAAGSWVQRYTWCSASY